jgi:hypothetical protein
MQGLDHGGKVIFCGSFNKVMFPSLRLGYLVVPRNLIEVFGYTKAMTTRHQSLLDQAVLCDFIEQGHLGRHLRRMRKIYEERFTILLRSAQEHLAEYLEIATIEAGLQTIGRLRVKVSAETVAQRASLAGDRRRSSQPVLPHGIDSGGAADWLRGRAGEGDRPRGSKISAHFSSAQGRARAQCSTEAFSMEIWLSMYLVLHSAGAQKSPCSCRLLYRCRRGYISSPEFDRSMLVESCS